MDTTTIAGAAESAGSLAGSLSERGEEVRTAADIDPGMWRGADAGTAADIIMSQAPALFDASDVFRRSQRALEDLVIGLVAAKEKLATAQDLVAGTDVRIDPVDGTVTTPVVRSADEARHNAGLARQARELIDEALRMADDADDAAIAALKTAPGVEVDPNAVPVAADPRAVDDWWKSLSTTQRLAYTTQFPDKIGGLDGIPSADRDRANRLRLETAVDQREERLREINDSGLLTAPGAGDLRSEKAELERELLTLDRLSERIADTDRYLLLDVDPAGDGRAIVATGNPDTADNVVTYVPGLYTELRTVVDSDIGRVDAMVDDANALDRESTTAGVMWLGYDAPDTLLEASTDGPADSGSADLRTFQDGLRVTNTTPDGSHNTLLGHSYGSTVIGHTARDGAVDADELVFVGSPGVGVDDVSELNVDPRDVHATQARYDIIGASTQPEGPSYDKEGPMFDDRTRPSTDTLSNHGTDPVDEEFGANVFDSDDGTRGELGLIDNRSVEAHSQYWEDGNVAREHIARIVIEPRD